jgi:SulP family sulfate permease
VLTLVIPLQYAVMNGVALSILLFIARQSNTVRVMEWVRQPLGLPIEQDPPATVPAEKALVLVPYGSLFFAAADAFEKELPKLTNETHHSVVILNLRQRSELGSTFLGVLKRYAGELIEHNSRLVLAEVGEETMVQFEKTGYIEVFGFDNIYPSTELVFHSLREAQHEAGKWIKQQKRLE